MEVANGAPAAQAQNGTTEEAGSYKLKFCTVCASNQNRYDTQGTWTGAAVD